MPSQPILSPGFPLRTAIRPPLSEATAKNPQCGEEKTAHLMRQEIYEVFDGASIETDSFTSETSQQRERDGNIN